MEGDLPASKELPAHFIKADLEHYCLMFPVRITLFFYMRWPIMLHRCFIAANYRIAEIYTNFKERW